MSQDHSASGKLSKTHLLFTIIIIWSISMCMSFFSFPDIIALNTIPLKAWPGDPYRYVQNNITLCSWLSAPYPPFYYHAVGFYYRVVSALPIFPTGILMNDPCPVTAYLSDKSIIFYAKLPYLVAHVATAIIFSRLFNNNPFTFFLLYLLNPITLFVSFIQGQYDSLPVLFVVWALVQEKRKNLPLVGLMLGVGGALKHVPFLYVPFFFRQIIGKLPASLLFFPLLVLPYAISILPFGSGYSEIAVSFSENTKMLGPGFSLFGYHVSYFLLAYILLLLLYIRDKSGSVTTGYYVFAAFSVYFMVTENWFVQRMIYVIPPLLIMASDYPVIMSTLPVLYLLFFMYTLTQFPGLFDHTLLRPLFPSIIPVTYPADMIKVFASLSSKLITVMLLAYLAVPFIRHTKGTVRHPGRHIVLHILAGVLYIAVLGGLLVVSANP